MASKSLRLHMPHTTQFRTLYREKMNTVVFQLVNVNLRFSLNLGKQLYLWYWERRKFLQKIEKFLGSSNLLFSPHHLPFRCPQDPFPPLGSPLVLLWKAVPRRAINPPAWSKVTSRPSRCTAEANDRSHCARESRKHFLTLWWFIQKLPQFSLLCRQLALWGAVSVEYWPRKGATGQRRSFLISTPTKAPLTAPSTA